MTVGDFTMPSLGADMDAGTVTEWLVKPGDEVHRGDIIAVVDTEKSTIEVEIFENGYIDRIIVPEGEKVPVGAVLAHISRQPSMVAEPISPPPAPPSMPTSHTPTHSPVVRHLAEKLGVDLVSIGGTGVGGSVTRADVERASRPSARYVRSSPMARKMATAAGIDLASIAGSGPGGAVTAADIEKASSALAPRPFQPLRPAGRPSAADRMDAMRRATGLLMARSKREIPHYYLSTTVDMTRAQGWLEHMNTSRAVTERLLPAVMLIKATALAVRRVPEMNGFFAEGEFQRSEAVNVGVAISLRSGGLIAPAIRDTDDVSLDDLMIRLRDLVGRARSGVLRSSEVSDATITVTNLGELGVDSVFGVIYPPQVALVGFGRVTERPVAEHGMIGVRPVVTATLAADHRASDGHRGGRFLAEIDRLLQEPEKL
jgi:pyruvate dehydrogenase E2 component (dihydrolipoamide acetyltransferase)